MGRTGAGKSSFLAALLRLIEPESGDVLIDNVNTRIIPLRVLRAGFAIIPQVM